MKSEAGKWNNMPSQQAAFLFDLDGTLIDSVYQHVLAWHEALEAEGIKLAIWRIHRKIGMSGGLFSDMLLRETGLRIDSACVDRLRRRHAAAYRHRVADIHPLPGTIGRRHRDLVGGRRQRVGHARRPSRPRA